MQRFPRCPGTASPNNAPPTFAVAIAYRAIQNGCTALFTTAAALIEDLSAASRTPGQGGVLGLRRMRRRIRQCSENGPPVTDPVCPAYLHGLRDQTVKVGQIGRLLRK